ncbi:hypothetical protein PIB30_093245 [Stylosanthes scabra]|uniref:Uncharacterized protein n=1 Tax=Stylosanthes scabra TaxID=79078 RepID=A0ABU6TUL6_9FABA|nr:hypothetical protein [Stylosanthes scabra]
MARNRSSPSTKGKAKVYGPPTRAPPRLAALRSQSAANPQPKTPVTPTISAPTSSLPRKKRPIQKTAGEGTSKDAAQSFKSCSSFILVELGLQRGWALVQILKIPILAFINFLPDVTARWWGGECVGAWSALTPRLTADHVVARVRRAVARPGQNPPEWLLGDHAIARCPSTNFNPNFIVKNLLITAQGARINENDKENPEEDPMEENAAKEGVRVEDDFVDYWALVRSDSENSVGNNYRFAGNAAPANSSVGSYIGPPPANN